MQIDNAGRLGHSSFNPKNEIVAPSAIRVSEK
jgi:hypothetical protein